MNIIGTGLSGLVGSRVADLLSPEYTFDNLSLETGFDITNRQAVETYITNSNAPWVFHFAAITDVDACEKEKSLGIRSSVWKVNVEATENIASICRKIGKHLLYVSTDFVFDGTIEPYHESDMPHPLSFYGQTKYEGEKRVVDIGNLGLIVRLSFPYRKETWKKADFVHRIMEKFQSGETITVPEGQRIVPTYIDDIAAGLKKLILTNAHGIYHLVGSQALTLKDIAAKIAEQCSFDVQKIYEVPFDAYYAGRAPRPFHAVLSNDKITKLGIRMSSFDEGLEKVRSQEYSVKLESKVKST